ncbi:hypothetical protein T484DRAFT_1807586, partial [Baffinella frigidus]
FSRWFDVYVARYDHDCPWISNVVGVGNIGYFIGFCSTVSVCLIAWDWIAIALLLRGGHADLSPGCKAGLLHAGLCPRWDQYIVWTLAYRKVAMGMLLLYIFFAVFTLIMTVSQDAVAVAFFTLVMTVSQVMQVCRNLTTNEAINWVRYPAFHREDGSFKNPYDRGLIHNVKQFFRGFPGVNPATPRGGSAASGKGDYAALVSGEK